MDDVVLMECDDETALFLVCVAIACIYHNITVFYAHLSYQSDLSLLNQF